MSEAERERFRPSVERESWRRVPKPRSSVWV